jgi:two-component system response regulator HydG
MTFSSPLPYAYSALLDSIQDPAIIISRDYQVLAANASYRELFGAGGEIEGRTCHRVSHGSDLPCSHAGEACPMEAALGTRDVNRVLHIHHTPRGDEHVEVEGRPIFDEQGELICFVEIIRQSRAASAQASGEGMVGRSASFNRMLGLIQRVAPSETTALLLGESGTGKELVARAIHDLSPRGHMMFVPVECSGLTESLFESELFGHEKGAFTGAHASKIGLVEAARGGTLFLDEVGDIPPTLQVKLLRLIETGTYRPVGSVEPHQADFRLICATHRDLKEMVREGKFRQDLYYRISAFPVTLPSLRERSGDIPLLVATLLGRIRGAEGKRLSREALNCLKHYDFPGNVRELRNILERASLMSDGDLIHSQNLPDECLPPSSEESREPQRLLTLEEQEQEYLRQVSASFPGDRKQLAKALGVSERTLFRKLQQAGDQGTQD